MKKLAFVYTINHFRGEKLLSTEIKENLIPTEGLNYIMGASATGAAQLTAWYIGLFSGNYTPVAGDTAAAFTTSSTEFTGYSQATRVIWTPGTVVTGFVDNSASQAVFSITTAGPTSIYDGFMQSASAKSATTGTLISAVKFATAKVVYAGDTLNITSSLTLVAV